MSNDQPNQVKHTLERLLSVQWQPDHSNISWHLQLIKEYFRHSSLWAKKLESTGKWPFFNIATIINNSIEVDKIAIEALARHVSKQQLGPYLSIVLEHTLCWASIQHTLIVTSPDLLKPFEPVIVLYENGGTIWIEHNFLVQSVSSSGFQKGIWKDYVDTDPYVAL